MIVIIQKYPMKRSVLLFFFLSLSVTLINAQSMLSIKEVYDFNVGDEFHLRANNVPPNASRIKIIGKKYSTNKDTIFYFRSLNNYSSSVDYTTSPPHLVYNFYVGNDTRFYTNLDSLVSFQFKSWPIDSCDTFDDTLYYSTQFCGAEVYEYVGVIGSCFEGQYTNEIYGKGLGLVWYHSSFPAQSYDAQYGLIYYKKGNLVCGIPDSSFVVANNEYEGFDELVQLYPNPFCFNTHLTTSKNFKNATLIIYDSFGKQIDQMNNIFGSTISLQRNGMKSGIYFIRLIQDNKILLNRKLMVTDK